MRIKRGARTEVPHGFITNTRMIAFDKIRKIWGRVCFDTVLFRWIFSTQLAKIYNDRNSYESQLFQMI